MLECCWSIYSVRRKSFQPHWEEVLGQFPLFKHLHFTRSFTPSWTSALGGIAAEFTHCKPLPVPKALSLELVSECCWLCTWTPICPPSSSQSTSGAPPREPPLGRFGGLYSILWEGGQIQFSCFPLLLVSDFLDPSSPGCSACPLPLLLVLYFRTQCSSRTSWAGGGGEGDGSLATWPMTHTSQHSAHVCICGRNKWTEWTGGAISGY